MGKYMNNHMRKVILIICGILATLMIIIVCLEGLKKLDSKTSGLVLGILGLTMSILLIVKDLVLLSKKLKRS